ncbi:hypothetical protein [Chryseobacterium sp. MEBOG07]|uniref:hypothetical protein n=1 Tax=Chryseobacterium sp. MEBOG07 TaxID=2879939 RepID=UPI001F2E2952|nr:hypothetical protein [Chryseobacterium sp. MEBOG07]UKB80234.1 hypothetical protein LF886_04295 [Chryseobacterium sp. MEBOG07]
MKEIKLKGKEDKNHYYLLESRELQEHEIGELLKKFLDKDEVVRVIEYGGIKASANQILIMRTDENNKFVNVFNIQDESDIIYLEN